MINLKKLPTCGSCGTTHKTLGLCNYCKALQASNNTMEDKIKSVVSLSKEVMADFYHSSHYKYESKKIDKCFNCGTTGTKKHSQNYLTFGDKTICKNCRLKGIKFDKVK